MALKGRLTQAQFGLTMPVKAAAFAWHQPPVTKHLECTRTRLDINLSGAAIIETL